MRIWSIHPKYLDAKGLVALWRETLLAKKVLEGKTKGYINHPQLRRFRAEKAPIERINQYLNAVLEESKARGYNFDGSKVGKFSNSKMTVTKGQIEYEMKHLLKKLKVRDPQKYEKFKDLKVFGTHPMFKVVEGDVEDWEVV